MFLKLPDRVIGMYILLGDISEDVEVLSFMCLLITDVFVIFIRQALAMSNLTMTVLYSQDWLCVPPVSVS